MLCNFLLKTDLARRLFHEVAKNLPVIDYHNHLAVSSLSDSKNPVNITQLWLTNDPYKHRAMRINGIREEFITGNAGDKDKFQAWAQTLPKTIGGPLFDWSRIELDKFFGIKQTLSEKNYEFIWNECNAIISSDSFSVATILKTSNAEAIFPCADICDDLSSFHNKYEFAVSPSFRGDSILMLNKYTFSDLIKQLEQAEDCSIGNLAHYKKP